LSHDTVYKSVCAQPVGELRKDLIACLRQANNKLTPLCKGQVRRGQIPDMLSIQMHPPEIEVRQFSGHWEGDLIKGEANASAVGTLVALVVYRVMRQSLKLPKRDLSPEKALSQLSRIQRTKVRIDNAQPIKGISSINDLQAQVVKSLKIKKPTQYAQTLLQRQV
jgi:IS30 family transposase